MAITDLALAIVSIPDRSIVLNWTAPLLSEQALYYNQDGGSWTYWKTVGAGVGSTYDGLLTANIKYGYYIHLYGPPQSDSNAVYIGFYSDTITETATTTESLSDSVYEPGATDLTDTIVETVNVTEVFTESITSSDTITETITVTDQVSDSQTVATDFAYYIASTDGKVFIYDSAYKSDNSVSILSSWESKVTDFSDAYPEAVGKWKTIYRIPITYVDKEANLTVIVSVSTDGGATWTTSAKYTVGTGDGMTKDTYFDFIKTGQYFKFRIELPSANKIFQLLGMGVEFLPCGDAFPIT